MDVILEVFDTFLFDRCFAYLLPAVPTQQFTSPSATISSVRQAPTSYVYEPASKFLYLQPSDFVHMSQWTRNNLYRQAISLYIITFVFGALIYFLTATLSYLFVFDKTAFKHPKYIKGQIAMEIKLTVQSIPVIALLTTPFFLLEVRGFSRLYDYGAADSPGLWYDVLQFPIFILFTDFCIYWIHRGLHHPLIYKHFHKAHHKWVVPTPFASHAFHPIDGFSQGVPYHIFPFLFPLNKFAYILLFMLVNIWTVTIHDGEYLFDSPIINGAANHNLHHLYFNFNYGQYTTVWDRLGGSFRRPNKELFQKEEKMGEEEWKRQVKEAEERIKEVEGVDERVYSGELQSKKHQ